MLGWLLRLGIAGALVAAAIWAWSQMNQDLEDEELDEEIPIEFEVPLDAEETVSEASADAGDTGFGPGADFAAGGALPAGESPEEGEPVAEGQAAGTTEATAEGEDVSSPNRTDGSVQDAGATDLQQIKGIGPVLEARLMEHGIDSIAALAATGAERLQELGFSAAQAEEWIPQARERSGQEVPQPAG